MTEINIDWDDFEVGPNDIEPGDAFVWDEALYIRVGAEAPEADLCEFWAMEVATGDLSRFDECGERLIPVNLTIQVERDE